MRLSQTSGGTSQAWRAFSLSPSNNRYRLTFSLRDVGYGAASWSPDRNVIAAAWAMRDHRVLPQRAGNSHDRVACQLLGWGGALLLMCLSLAVCRADPTTAGMDAYRRGDYATGLAKLRPYAELGHGPASVVVGRIDLDGAGVAADPATAARYFRLGADNANPLATNYLAELYAAGNGVQRDSAEAVRQWRQAGHPGNAFAAHNLGIEYWRGDGVARDKAMALTWLDAAITHLHDAQQGHRASFVGDRDKLVAEMTHEEVESATKMVTPKGPTEMVRFPKGSHCCATGTPSLPVAAACREMWCCWSSLPPTGGQRRQDWRPPAALARWTPQH